MKHLNSIRRNKRRAVARNPLSAAIAIGQLILYVGVSHPLAAAPENGRVTQGVGNITQNANVTNVNQASDLLTVEWSSFNVGQQEIVNFIQPHNQAWVLNHILQNGPSHIDGQINANGNVLLINPRGMVFGSNALINAGSFTASSLWLDKEDFLNGNFYFKDIDPSQGRIVNHGLISAATGGYINLLGESISNEGILSANMGYVSIAAGSELYLTFDEQNFLGVKVTQEVINNDAGLKAAINNKGKITGESAKIILQAESAKNLFDLAVNHQGVIEATGFDGGSVKIDGTQAVAISGDIDTSAESRAGNVDISGQSVEVLGDIISRGDIGGRVWLQAQNIGIQASATIDVSGQFAGGQALIGGGYRGQLAGFNNALNLQVLDGAKIYADAIQSGNGGEVILWSDNYTVFAGSISAQGGRDGGNGGFVETSSRDRVRINGNVTTLAANGETGTWLLDPGELEVVAEPGMGGSLLDNQISVDTINTALLSNNYVLTTTDYPKAMGSGDITFSVDLNAGATSNKLTVIAENDIILNASITTGGALELDAVNNIQLSTGQAITAGGQVDFDMLTYDLQAGSSVNGSAAVNFSYKATDKVLNIDSLIADIDKLTAGSITFDLGSGTGTLSADSSAKTFTVSGTNTLSASVSTQTVSFDGVDVVNNVGGDDSVDAGGLGASLGAGNFTVADIELNNFDALANTGELTGTSGSESFNASADNQLEVNLGTTVTFSGVTGLDGNGGDDSLNINGQNAQLDAAGFDSRGISVSGVDTVSQTANLVGSSNNDSVRITATNQITAGTVTFNDVSNFDGAGGTGDSVGIEDAGVSLAGFSSTFSGVALSNVEVIDDVGALTGTAADETFTASTNNEIQVSGNSYTFRGVDSLDGGSDTSDNDSLNIAGAGAELTATGFDARNIAVSDIETVNQTATLTGSAADDAVRLTANNQVTTAVASTTTNFNNVNSYDGAGGTGDSVGIEDAGVSLAGFSSTINGVALNNVEVIDDVGALTGTAADETFTALSNNEIQVSGNSYTFRGVDSLDGGSDTNDNDSLSIAGSGAELTANGFNARNITTSDIETVNQTATLTGSAADDAVRLTANNQVTTAVASTTTNFNNVNSYDGAGGTGDSVGIEDAGVSLAGFSSTINGVALNNVEVIDDVGALTGTAADETFTASTNNEIQVSGNSYTFRGVDSLDGGSDTNDNDSLSIAGSGAELTATGFNARNITTSDIETVNQTSTLTGSAADDAVRLTANNQVTTAVASTTTNFNNVNSYDGAGGTGDSVGIEDAGVSLAGFSSTINGVALNNVEVIDDVGALTGTAADETFTASTNNEIQVSGNSYTFRGVDSLDGGSDTSDNDSLNIAGAGAELSATGFDARNIAVSDIETVSQADTINGSSQNDNFVATGTKQIEVAGIEFSGVNSVTGGGATTSDSVDLQTQNADLITGGFSGRAIDFSGVAEVENTGELTATVAPENFELLSNGAIRVNGIEFAGVSVLDGGEAGDGSDEDQLVGDIDSLVIQGNESVQVNKAATSFTATNVELVDSSMTNAASLIGQAATDDNFSLTSNHRASAQGMSFVGIDAISGQAEDNINLNNLNTQITGLGFDSSNISISGINSVANTGNLVGTALDDDFVASDTKQIQVAGIEFSGVNSVTGGGATTRDSVDLQAQNADLISGGFSGRAIDFSGVAEVENTGELTATAAPENFELLSGGAVRVNGVEFTGVTVLDGGEAGDGSDEDQLVGDIDSLVIQGNESVQVNKAATSFTTTNVELVDSSMTNAASLIGQAATDDNFLLTSNHRANAQGMSFVGIDAISGQAEDSINLNSLNAQITSLGFDSANISIAGINTIANTGSLGGTAADDQFSVTGINQITTNIAAADRVFNSVTNLDGQAGIADTVNVNDTGVLLSAADTIASGVVLTNVELIDNTGALTGSSANEIFTASINNQVAVQGNATSFRGVDSLDGGGSGDNDILNVNSAGASLTATGFNSRGIDVIAVETVNQTATLTGSAADDAVRLTANNQVTAAVASTTTTFNNVNSYDGAGGAGDSVGIEDAGVSLAGFSSTFSGVALSNVEVIDDVGALTGTAADETFTASTNNEIQVSGNSYTFKGVDSLDGGSDTNDNDSLNIAGAGAELSATGFDARNIAVSDIETVNQTATLTGSAADDAVRLTANNQVTAAVASTTTTFNNVNSYDGAGGTDDSVGIEDAGVSLAGFSSTFSGVTLSNVEVIDDVGALTGTAADETFTASASNEIQVSGNSYAFRGVDSLDGGSDTNDNDSLNIAGAGAELSATGFDARNIAVSDIETVNQTATLTGSAADDAVRLTANNQVTAAVASTTTTFNNVNSYDGAGGTDDSVGIEDAGVSLAGFSSTFSGVALSNVEVIDDVGALTGTAADETFTASASNEILVSGNNYTFRGVDSLDGGSDTNDNDSLNIAGSGAELTATGFDARNIAVSDIETVNQTSALTGSSGDDAVRLSANNQVTAATATTTTTFNNVNSYDAAGGTGDSVGIEDSGVSLAGFNSMISGVTLSNVEVIEDTGQLTGSSASEHYTAANINEVQVAGISWTFRGVDALDGGSDVNDNDHLDVSGAGAQLSSGGFISQGITVSNIEEVSNTVDLIGTQLNDSFTVTAENQVSIAAVDFLGVTQLQAGDGSDTVDLNNAGATLTANGFDSQSIEVNSVEVIDNSGAIIATAGDDVFNFIDNSSLEISWGSNQAIFWNVSSLDAGDGIDRAVGTDAADQFALVQNASGQFIDNTVSYSVPLGGTVLIENVEQVDAAAAVDRLAVFNSGLSINNGENIVQNISFTNFELFSETGELLLVSNSANTIFSIEGDRQVRNLDNNIVFEGVISLVGDVQNQVNLNGGGANLQTGGFRSQNIDVSQINIVNDTGTIFGSSESYQVLGNQQISVNSINFSGVTSVAGGSAADLGGSDAILNGLRLSSSGIDFSGISTFSQLSDLRGVDSFVVQNDNEITAGGFRFTGLNSLEASSGDIGGRGARVISAGEIQSAGINIRSIGNVSNTGQLIGSDNAEIYRLQNGGQLSIAGIEFSAVTGLDGAGGVDSIDLNGLGADLQENGFTVADFSISNIEEVANTGTVRGSASAERFVIENDGSISVSGFSFAGVTEINAGGGQDSLDVAGRGVDMLGEDSFSAGSISISSVEQFSNTGALRLTDADDNLASLGDGEFSLQDYRFENVTAIDAAGGSNSLRLANLGLQVDGQDLNTLGVSLINIQSLAEVGTLSLSDLDENIELLASQSFQVNGLQLDNVRTLQAGGGQDSINANGFTSLLLANGNLQLGETEVVAVELINNSDQLIGSTGNDSFTLLDVGVVELDRYRFNGLKNLDGGAGQDTLSFASVDSISLDFGSSTAGSVGFNDNVALAGFESIEQVNLPNVQSLSLSGNASLQVADFVIDGALTLDEQVALEVNGNAGFNGSLSLSGDSQILVSGDLQATESIVSSDNSQATFSGDVILGNGLQATGSSVITIGGDLSAQSDVSVIDDAQLVMSGSLSTDSNLNLDNTGQLQIEGSIDVGGDLNALGQSNIDSKSDINIVGQVQTSPTATINADSINVNVPEEKVVTVQPEIDISLAVFSEIKVFINSNSSVRNTAETSALYSDDDLVDALIESATELAEEEGSTGGGE